MKEQRQSVGDMVRVGHGANVHELVNVMISEMGCGGQYKHSS